MHKLCKKQNLAGVHNHLIVSCFAKENAKGDCAYLITIKNKSLCATLLFLISSRSLLFLE